MEVIYKMRSERNIIIDHIIANLISSHYVLSKGKTKFLSCVKGCAICKTIEILELDKDE